MSVLPIQSDLPDASAAVDAQNAAVQAVGLCKLIDERPILSDIDLELPAGGYVALLGANGAGKSSLLNVLATLTPYTRGELYLFAQRVGRGAAALRARIGMIGHQPMLYRNLSARENLVLFGRLYGLANAASRADEMLDVVGLSDRASDPLVTFSRGMVQRVAIGRALMHEPELLLADEPFAGLDVASTRVLERLLARFNGAGKTIVLTNHDVHQSLRIARRVVVLRHGRIVANQPAHRFAPDELTEEVATP